MLSGGGHQSSLANPTTKERFNEYLGKIRFSVPENQIGLMEYQWIDVDEEYEDVIGLDDLNGFSEER